MEQTSGFGHGLPSPFPSLPFAAQESLAAKLKFPVSGDEEHQQHQQHQQHEQQKKKREAQERQQGAYICSRNDCGKRFERSNALQRHIASIHNCKGVLCPFCVSKKKTFNRSDNFTRCVPTCPPHARYLGALFSCFGVVRGRVGRGGHSDDELRICRHVATAHPPISGDDERLLGCLSELYQGTGRRTSRKRSP